MMQRFLRAFLSVFRSLKIIRKQKLWPFFVLPGLLSLISGMILALGVFYASLTLLERLTAWMIDTMPDIILPLIWMLALVPAVFFYFISYRFVAALFVLPFLGPLQDRLEELQFGRKKETSLSADIMNALTGSLRALFQIAGLLLLIPFTLPLGPLQLIPLALYDGYFMGRGIFDTLLERDYPKSKDRMQILKTLRPESLGLGLGTLLLLLIPVAGILIASGSGLIAAFQLRYGSLKDVRPEQF
jgi:CysZ protein